MEGKQPKERKDFQIRAKNSSKNMRLKEKKCTKFKKTSKMI